MPTTQVGQRLIQKVQKWAELLGVGVRLWKDMGSRGTNHDTTPPTQCHPGLTMAWALATQISMGMYNIHQPSLAVWPLPHRVTHYVWHLRHHHWPVHSMTTVTPTVIMQP